MSYTLFIVKSAEKDILAIKNKKDRQRIINRIESLAEDPRPPQAIKLTGSESYRVRQGKYRIVYTIIDLELLVEVVKVAHRKDVYR